MFANLRHVNNQLVPRSNEGIQSALKSYHRCPGLLLLWEDPVLTLWLVVHVQFSPCLYNIVLLIKRRNLFTEWVLIN